MKIKDAYITPDAYIGGTFVRDDGTELPFLIEFNEDNFDSCQTDERITREEADDIIDVMWEHVGCRLRSAIESINMELMDAEFELED